MFDEYACIPLDVPLPPIDVDRFREFVQTHSERCAFTNNKIRLVLFYARKPVIDGQMLLHACDPRFEEVPPGASFDWDPVFRKAFPELVAWFEALPFTELHGIDLVTQTDNIRDHLDCFGYNNSVTYFERFRHVEPRYYRIVFAYPDDDVARRQSFYVSREHNGERHYVQLPSGTATIAMSSSTCYHGATHNAGHYKTTAAVYGVLDERKHLALLKRSLKKYGRQAVKFAAAPVEGPGAVLPYAG